MKEVKPKKIQWAWGMYDWANSAYNLVITSTIFPIYYMTITRNPDAQALDYVNFFGWKVINSSLLNYAIAAAYLIIAFLSPILSSIADYKGNKKRFMQFFCYLGSISCCAMFFFEPGRIELGILLAMLAAIGFCGSLVFYNAYLPEIASESEQDKLSAKGFALGYIGSVLLQIICFALIMFPFSDGTFAPRLSFLLVGIWWVAFAQISFKYLPNRPSKITKQANIIKAGFQELKKVGNQISTFPKLKTYLIAFFFYSMGVQTVMLAAAEFGSKEIRKEVDGSWVHLEAQDLIITILLIQLIAILGAYTMATLSKKYGNLKVLMFTVIIWIAICISAYFTRTSTEFYMLAIMVGLVMGGIQSLSRSTYSKMIPITRDTTSFFSFYDVTEKIAIVIGMFTFGFLEHLTGDMRNSIVALALFFLIGFVFLGIANRQKLDVA